MIANAYAWAEKNGRKRTNPVHGKWEIQLVLDDKFELKNLELEQSERSGGFTVQVRFPFFRFIISMNKVLS